MFSWDVALFETVDMPQVDPVLKIVNIAPKALGSNTGKKHIPDLNRQDHLLLCWRRFVILCDNESARFHPWLSWLVILFGVPGENG